MKKTAVLTLTVCILNIFAAGPSVANAAFLEDKLAEVIAQDPNAARIQELLRLKQTFNNGNKQAVVETLAKAAFDRTGHSNIAAVASATDIRQTAQTVIRQQVEEKVNAKAAPYYKELAMLAALFNLNGELQPQSAMANNSLAASPANYHKLIQMTSTAYAPGVADNGKWGNLTHLGTRVRKGVVAVDPAVIPLGTKLWVEGYGEAIAEDTGSAIKGNRIDLAFNNRQEALNYGIQRVNVYVME